MASQAVIDCCESISKRSWKIAFAESFTAGGMCSACSDTESRDIIRGGIFCADNFVKENILKIPKIIIDRYASESAEMSESLALYTAAFFESDVAVGITGKFNDGESPEALVYIHAIFPLHTLAYQGVFYGTLDEIRQQVIDKASSLICEKLAQEDVANK